MIEKYHIAFKKKLTKFEKCISVNDVKQTFIKKFVIY